MPDFEEQFRELRCTNNPALRQHLILKHKWIAVSQAKRYIGRGEPLEDIVQAGTVGLIGAVDRYDPDCGVLFRSYATDCVRGEIWHHFRDKGGIHAPRVVKEAAVKAKRIADNMSVTLGREPTHREVAKECGTSEELVSEALHYWEVSAHASLDEFLAAGDNLPCYTEIDVEQILQRADLLRAIMSLPLNQREVVRMTYFANKPQTAIAKKIGCSQMQVSRLHRLALERLRQSSMLSGFS